MLENFDFSFLSPDVKNGCVESFEKINKFLALEDFDFKSVLKKRNTNFEEYLSALIVAHFKFSKQQLRLEQIAAIYVGYHYPSLNQIGTGEGKTNIIGFTALLRSALKGEQVRILTTNEYLASDSATKMMRLAGLCGLKIGSVEDQDASDDLDIYYTTVDAHVKNSLKQKDKSEKPDDEKRLKSILVDEVDYCFILFPAQTKIILSEPEEWDEAKQKRYIVFLRKNLPFI